MQRIHELTCVQAKITPGVCLPTYRRLVCGDGQSRLHFRSHQTTTVWHRLNLRLSAHTDTHLPADPPPKARRMENAVKHCARKHSDYRREKKWADEILAQRGKVYVTRSSDQSRSHQCPGQSVGRGDGEAQQSGQNHCCPCAEGDRQQECRLR